MGTPRDDSAEVALLQDALAALRCRSMTPRPQEEVDRLRQAVLQASAALARKEWRLRQASDETQTDEGETTWERIRWPDNVPLPEPGQVITPATRREGETHMVVVDARPDFEPGWVQVELRLPQRG